MAAYTSLVQKPFFLPFLHQELGRRGVLPAYLPLRKRRRTTTCGKTIAFLRPPDIGESIARFAHGVLWDTFLSATSGVSMDSVVLMAPVLGLMSGTALYLSRRGKEVTGAGEWILITSPTPFNRFVMLRCPSISFGDGKCLGQLNEKLLMEETHFVKVDGRIPVGDLKSGELGRSDQDVSYQRLCLSTADGGVISLDWPADLDLGKERGMDTTVLIVPGTTEGSLDKWVLDFVKESMRHGLFPVVMNPRGCAGSPVTTARLFTAADSDDICTAVQFLSRSRMWSTLLAVGWGYGANMLTKYLSEVFDRSPLTAVACINNPFDLEEATRSSPSCLVLDKKFTEGSKDILRANKELFRGRGKGFNVEEALSATSMRDFDKAISMVSCGFDSIEEFYKKSNTRDLIERVKIPVLFIQTDEGAVPLVSVPHSAIAENPHTSLLLCSSASTNPRMKESPSTLSWCQNLIIDWFAAVELAFLKGRHPLLKETDIALNPSKGLMLVNRNTLCENVLMNKQGHGSRNVQTPLTFKGDNTVDGRFNGVGSDFLNEHMGRSSSTRIEPQQAVVDHILEHVEFVDDKAVEERPPDDPGISTMGQVLQTAEVVMKMIDVTMPGTLGDEQKKKVLAAVGKGETLFKALQEAVPEDVRAKLTAAVSELAQMNGTKLNITDLINLGWVPSIPVQMKSKIAGSIERISGKDGELATNHYCESTNNLVNIEEESLHRYNLEEKTVDLKADPSEFTLNNELPSVIDYNSIGGRDVDMRPVSSEILSSKLQSSKSSSSKTDVSLGNNVVASEMTNPLGSLQDDNDLLEENVYTSANGDINKEITMEENLVKRSRGKNVQEGDDVLQKGSLGTVTRSDSQENNVTKKDPEIENHSPSDKDRQNSSVKDDVATKEAHGIEKNADEHMQGAVDQNKENSSKKVQDLLPSVLVAPDPPSLGGMSQALNALTGFDDSTQIAVNSVFGVIENVIEQLQKDDNEGSDRKKVKNLESENVSIDNSSGIEKENSNNVPRGFDIIQSDHQLNKLSISSKVQNASCQSVVTDSLNLSLENCKTIENVTVGISKMDDEANASAIGSKKEENNGLTHGLSDCSAFIRKQTKSRSGNRFPLHIILNPFGDSSTSWSHSPISVSMMKLSKALDLASTNDLLLEYFPDEGQWKLFDNLEDNDCPSNEGNRAGNGQDIQQAPDVNVENIIEPSYVILDAKREPQSSELAKITDHYGEESKLSNREVEELTRMVKSIVLSALGVEVVRKLGIHDKDGIEPGIQHEMEQLANAVSLVAKRCILRSRISSLQQKDKGFAKLGTLRGDDVMVAISVAAKEASCLQNILPVGVIVGSSLASLGKFFHVDPGHDDNERSSTSHKAVIERRESSRNHEPNGDLYHAASVKFHDDANNSLDESVIASKVNDDKVMVGAVTAALGTTAILAHNQAKRPLERHGIDCSSSSGRSTIGDLEKEEHKLEDGLQAGSKNNIMRTLAEKAISIASPVVPVKDDGEIDHDRLVAVLADLGQKGGFLRLIGKVALLWGGIRGAMSLTDRLISFLRIAERPLFHRLVGSACMVSVLWSPVVIPLLPTLLQKWAARSSAGIVEYCCIIGLYISLMILVMLWGKRIRGYENPITQYGLELRSKHELHNMLKGFAGGIILVVLIHVLNSFLGYASFSLPQNLLFSSTSIVDRLKTFGELLVLVARATVTSVSVAVVEELVFRSWLPEEIAVDLGYDRAIIISGFGFALFQWSLPLIPGHWLLSFALTGIRERTNGSLSVPIGIQAGVTSTAFIIRSCGFLKHHQFAPFWVGGACPWHPFSGGLGLGFVAILAILLRPRQLSLRNMIS